MTMAADTREVSVGGAQAIRRAIDVVKAVARLQRMGASLNRVKQATDLNTSTAFRILRSLTEERMLRFDETDRHYHLGELAFELGLAAQSQNPIPSEWRDAVDTVARNTRLTTYLMARSDSEAICLLCVQGSTAIRAMPIDVGERLPLGIGAGSLAILSTLDDEEVRQIVAGHQAQLDPFPGGRREALDILKRVETTRRLGYALSTGTVAKGLAGIGVAIQPRRGLIQLALSVSLVADTIGSADVQQIASVIAAAIKSRGS